MTGGDTMIGTVQPESLAPSAGMAQAPRIFGIGVDVVDVERFREVLERRPGLASRLFTEDEVAYARRMADPAQRLAARFAGKEAVAKALGTGIWRLGFKRVEIVRGRRGRPGVELHAAALDMARRIGAGGILISMTHTRKLAAATAVALSGHLAEHDS